MDIQTERLSAEQVRRFKAVEKFEQSVGGEFSPQDYIDEGRYILTGDPSAPAPEVFAESA